MPDQALVLLRATLKSLSVKIKTAATQDQEASLIFKAWYAEHVQWAQQWTAMCPTAIQSNPWAIVPHDGVAGKSADGVAERSGKGGNGSKSGTKRSLEEIGSGSKAPSKSRGKADAKANKDSGSTKAFPVGGTALMLEKSFIDAIQSMDSPSSET